MNNALRLPGWEVTGMRQSSTVIEISARYLPVPEACIKCGSTRRPDRYGTKQIDYQDLPYGRRTVIRAAVRRLRCKDCLETFMQPLPHMDTRRRMTKRCVEHIEQQGGPRTYADLARTFDVDEKTIRNICNGKFDADTTARGPIATPTILGIDELTLMRRKRTIFVDIAGKRFLDLIDAMNRGRVERWLVRLPQREKVQLVTMDMWGGYKSAVRATLPNAKIVIDKWHVLSKLNAALDRVRNSERRKAGIKKNPQKGRRLLQTSRHNLSPMRRMLVDGIIANDPVLDAAWNAKEVFYDIWDEKTRDGAERQFDRWAASIPDSVEEQYRPIAKMVQEWRTEIFNYFDYPVTNAYTEAVNGQIKKLNRAGNGYSFEHIRAKAHKMETGPYGKCQLCKGVYPVTSFKAFNFRPPNDPKWTQDQWVTVCGSCHYHLRDIHIPKELPPWIEIRNGTDVYIRKSG